MIKRMLTFLMQKIQSISKEFESKEQRKYVNYLQFLRNLIRFQFHFLSEMNF